MNNTPTLAPDLATAGHEFEARCTAYDHTSLDALRQKEYGRFDQAPATFISITRAGVSTPTANCSPTKRCSTTMCLATPTPKTPPRWP